MYAQSIRYKSIIVNACADFFPSETTLLKYVMTPAESIKQRYYGSIIFSL